MHAHRLSLHLGGTQGIAILLVGTAFAAACVVNFKRHGVEHHVYRLAGPTAVNCGTIPAEPPEADPTLFKVVAECMASAYHHHQSFFFLHERRSIDSSVASEIVGTGQGQLFQIWYDSAPCGGPGCRERFTAEACSPSLVERQALDPLLQCKLGVASA